MTGNQIIASDGLKFLNIKETFFINESAGSQVIIRPLQMEADKWVVAVSAGLEQNGSVRLETGVGSFLLKARTEAVRIGEFSQCFLITFTEWMPDFLVQKILRLKKTQRDCTRRSEERYQIGLKNYEAFGFASAVQFFKFREQKCQCIVNNVSVHGVMITVSRTCISNGERILLLFKFSNPEENLVLPALIVSSNYVADGYQQFSLNLTEPLSFLWQERILRYSAFIPEE